VMAGFGRTGSWFAWQHPDLNPTGVVPDLITFAKGSNSGYVPIGGVIMPGRIHHAFDERVFPGGLTYSGHPLAAASVVATLDAMREEGIVEHADRIGREILGPGLAELAAKHALIGEARGIGVFWALDLVADPVTKAPLPAAQVGALRSALLERGFLPFVSENRIHVVPPCIITADETRRGLAMLDEALAAVAV